MISRMGTSRLFLQQQPSRYRYGQKLESHASTLYSSKVNRHDFISIRNGSAVRMYFPQFPRLPFCVPIYLNVWFDGFTGDSGLLGVLYGTLANFGAKQKFEYFSNWQKLFICLKLELKSPVILMLHYLFKVFKCMASKCVTTYNLTAFIVTIYRSIAVHT